MNKREIARQFSLDTVIYDPELSTKAAKALSADMIEVSPEQCFDMDVFLTGMFIRMQISIASL